ncbi:ubiquitin conjugation factor E4 [Thraustotheca clavata]|uniref:RING-type E3 ubiquitin transferase n=1 Tax=Thraustotheca clavata TaxID=74557 RepID=A0A1V9YVB7_9STRA|nr:ubiquitin conjugation factor E4 [Thraustotheca clavata]
MATWIRSWMNGDEKQGEENELSGGNQDAHVPSAEELRQKRLERLATLQTSNSNEQIPIPTPAPISVPKEKQINKQQIHQEVPIAAPQPVVKQPVVKKKSLKRNPLHDVLSRILQVTLTPPGTNEYVYCQVVGDTINGENLSEIMYMRLISEDATISTLKYLFDVYQRSRMEGNNLLETELNVMKSLLDMTINYSVTCLLEPEMFPTPTTSTPLEDFDSIVRHPTPSTQSFLELVAQGLETQGGVAAVGRIVGPIFQKLVSEIFLGTQSLLAVEVWAPPMQTIGSLVRIKSFATVFVNMPGFLLTPPLNGRRLQDATALGILLRLSTDSPDPAIKDMFSNITKRTRNDVDKSLRNLRNELKFVHNLVTDIFKCLLKAGPVCKERVLAWLSQALEVNQEMAKENPNPALTSTAGMLINLSVVLLRLCGPFLPPTSTKHSLIDPTFLRASPNPIFPSDSTKLVQATDQITTTSKKLTDFNFITQCFYLTVECLHLGPIATMGKYMRLMRQLSYVQNLMTTRQEPQIQMQFDAMVTAKMIMDAKLLMPEFLHELVRFILLSADVVNRICLDRDGKSISSPLTLPLITHEQELLVPFVPEHIVEDIVNSLLFVARLAPQELGSFSFDNLLNMALIFLSSPQLIRSPHLRAKMSECLFEICLPPQESEDRPTLGLPSAVNALTENRVAQQHLAPCLLALYGDVEQTGFYEKLEHRYNIACLLKYLWKCRAHKPAFLLISQNQPAFVKFAHGLMNHINSLLTDALTNLPEIKALQEEAQSPQWGLLDQSVQEQKQSLLQEKERTVTSSLQLANETIHMMSYLTSEIQAPFLMPELEDRLVGMLNSVLVKLAGPRGLELKVANPETYKFRPKIMLREVVETILHFSDIQSFQTAVASNGLYDPTVYRKCLHILQRTQLIPPPAIASFENLTDTVEAIHASIAKDDQVFDDAPEEFMDPLLWQLMKEPVTLPSGYIVDKSTITQHLMNDATDPFTRAPLTLDQLVPNAELKSKIDEWIAAQRRQE